MPLRYLLVEVQQVICKFIIAKFINTFYAEPHARDNALLTSRLFSVSSIHAQLACSPCLPQKEKEIKKILRQSNPKAVLGYLKME